MLDGKEEGFQVTPQKPAEWIAVRHVELDIASIGKLNITSGATEQGELEEELVDTHILVEKHPLFNTSNADLDKLLAKKRKLEKEISNLQAEYKGKNPERMSKKAAKLKKEAQQLRNSAGNAKGKLDLPALKKEFDRIRSDMDEKEADLAGFIQKHREIKETINSSRIDLKGIDVNIEDRREEMDRLNQDGLSQQQREMELESVLSKQEEEREKLAVLKDKYGDPAAKLKKDIEMFERAEVECRKKLDECKQAVYSTKSEISHLKEVADHVQLARLKEKKSDLETQLKEKEAYLEGLGLLSDRIKAKEKEVVQQVHGPLEKRVNQLLRSLTGLKYDGIVFDEKLVPREVRVSGINDPEPWERLSYGLREQISVLTRLALGEITGNTDKQMVVLDDPLVNTDDLRMVEMFHIFEALSDKLQLIIFTCHGRNYRPLNATKLEMVKP